MTDAFYDMKHARALILVAAAAWTGMLSACGAPSADLLESPPGHELNAPLHVCGKPLNFGALSLSEAVRAAVCYSTKVRQAETEISQQKGNMGAAEAKYYPTLTSTLTTNRIGKAVTYRQASDANYALRTYSGNAEVGLSWLLFDSGKRGANLDKAKALWRASLYDFVLTNREQVISVADAYYRARAAAASLHAAEEASVRAAQNFHAIGRLLSNGVGAVTDELLAKGAWQRSQADSEDRKKSSRVANATLATKIGVSAGEDLHFASEQRQFDAISRAPESCELDVLLRVAMPKNPRLSAARQRKIAALADEIIIASDNRMSVSLHANRYFGLTPSADSVAKQEVAGWSVGLLVRIPLFEGFSTKHMVQAAQAKTHAAALEERNVRLEEELKILIDYENALSGEKKLSLLLGAVESSKAAYEGAQVRHKHGVGTLIELLRAQEELARVSQDSIQTHYELLAAKLRVAVALDATPPRSDF